MSHYLSKMEHKGDMLMGECKTLLLQLAYNYYSFITICITVIIHSIWSPMTLVMQAWHLAYNTQILTYVMAYRSRHPSVSLLCEEVNLMSVCLPFCPIQRMKEVFLFIKKELESARFVQIEMKIALVAAIA